MAGMHNKHRGKGGDLVSDLVGDLVHDIVMAQLDQSCGSDNN